MVQSVFLLTFANLALRAVSMLFQVYLSDQVGAAGLGLLQLILTVHAFAMTLGTSGIRTAAMYLSAEEYGHRRFSGIRSAMLWCIGTGLALSSLVGAGMVLGAEGLALHWVKDLRAAGSLKLLGVTLPLNCLSSILCGYFTACGQIKKLVAVEVSDRIATVLLTMWLLSRGIAGDVSHACISIIGGGALASLGSVLVLLLFMCSDLRRHRDAAGGEHMGRRLLRFCVPVALNDYLRSGLGTLEQFLIPYGLAKCVGSRTKALADYGVIHGMVFPVLMFLSTVLFSLSDLLIPKLARYKAETHTAGIRRVTKKSLQTSWLFSASVGGLIYVLAPALGLLFYDSSAAAHYLKLFAPLLPVLYLDCIVDGMHKGLGQQIYCVRVNTLTNLLDVIGLFFLLPRYGIGGYYFTYVLTHVLNFILSIHRLLKVTDYRPKLRYFLYVTLCVCGVAWFVGSFVPLRAQWSSVLFCGGLYLSVVFLLLVLIRPQDA